MRVAERRASSVPRVRCMTLHLLAPKPCVDWCSDMFSPFWFTAVNAPGVPRTSERHRRLCSGHRNRGCCTRPSIIGCFDPTRLQLQPLSSTLPMVVPPPPTSIRPPPPRLLFGGVVQIIGGKHIPFLLALLSSSVAVLCCGNREPCRGTKGARGDARREGDDRVVRRWHITGR